MPYNGHHQVRAIVELDAGPIPADAPAGNLAPLVVHPAGADHRTASLGVLNPAGNVQACARVVVGRTRFRAHVQQPGAPVQHRIAPGNGSQFQADRAFALVKVKAHIIALGAGPHQPPARFRVHAPGLGLLRQQRSPLCRVVDALPMVAQRCL